MKSVTAPQLLDFHQLIKEERRLSARNTSKKGKVGNIKEREAATKEAKVNVKVTTEDMSKKTLRFNNVTSSFRIVPKD